MQKKSRAESRDVQIHHDLNGTDKTIDFGKTTEMGEAPKDSSDRCSEDQCFHFASIERWCDLRLSRSCQVRSSERRPAR